MQERIQYAARTFDGTKWLSIKDDGEYVLTPSFERAILCGSLAEIKTHDNIAAEHGTVARTLVKITTVKIVEEVLLGSV